jgi:hypothetical protein
VIAALPAVGERSVPLGPHLVLSDRNLHQDVVVPGSSIAGRLRWAESREPVRGVRDLHVTWRLSGDETESKGTIPAREDGTFVIDALSPGTYGLAGHPLELTDAGGRPVEVTVGAEGTLLEVTVDVRQPPAR